MNDTLLRAAVTAHQAGNLVEAARLYGLVLNRDARNFHALYFLGFLNTQTGNDAEAERLMGAALAVNPRSPDAFYNHGCALQRLQRNEEAIIAFDAAIALKADYADAFVNRGVAFLALRRPEEALRNLDRALMLRPDDVETLANRGLALFELKRFADSAGCYEKTLVHHPDHPYSLGTMALARAFGCDWRSRATDLERVSGAIRAGKRTIAAHGATLILDDPGLQREAARVWAADRHPPAPPLAATTHSAREKIRLAYLSADFSAHATAYLAAGLFEHHDRTRFETVGVSFGPDDGSAMRARLSRAFDRFVDIRAMSDADAARLIRDMEIDIAVDLKGFTEGARPGILAFRPAPVQVNYLGHPGTMGAPYIDYIVADRTLIADDDMRYYSERVVWLPDCYQANDDRRTIPEKTPARADAGLPAQGFVFAAFNNLYKITPAVFDVWMRLLAQVDGSVLWLFADNSEAMGNLRDEAERRGIPKTRLVFAPRVGQDDHIARHRLADLFVDTTPCCAHTTASDSLWAGLPLVTIKGATFAGRVAASALAAVGLPDLVTTSLEDYENLALSLAREPQRLVAVKARLAANRTNCPLFDTAKFTRQLEAAFATMHDRRLRGLEPAAFAVEP